MDDKKNKGTIVIWAATTISACIRLLLVASMENIVVIKGIRAFRTYATVSNIALLIFSILAVISTVKALRTSARNKAEKANYEAEMVRQEQVAIEKKKRQESYLSASGTLIERILRDQLSEGMDNEWSVSKEKLMPLFEQSIRMDKMQEKLKTLITKNGADALDDTEDVLEKAEQGLLRNMRKTLNYMEVCDPNVTEERAKVEDSAEECYKANQEILDNVSDFLMAMTEYLNKQGSTDSLDLLATYKETLLGTIKTQTKDAEIKDTEETQEQPTLVF